QQRPFIMSIATIAEQSRQVDDANRGLYRFCLPSVLCDIRQDRRHASRRQSIPIDRGRDEFPFLPC
ncbi:hypothetical protein, partial [Puniceibacterium antarcticum]|uniref:hypothetical protein n=1 Tax=Puniceibacterium antarcticum TaxID=1206336 RepID=UPI001C556CD0